MYKKKKLKRKQRHLNSKYQQKLSFYQNCLKKYPTIAEIRFRYALCKYFGVDFYFENRKGLPFKEQRQFHFPKQNKGYIVDFYVPKFKIVFEVDGDSHIGKEKYDKNRDMLLKSRKIKVFHITNEETVDIDFALEFIRNAIEYDSKKPKKKRKKRVFINLSREEELRMQEEFLKRRSRKNETQIKTLPCI